MKYASLAGAGILALLMGSGSALAYSVPSTAQLAVHHPAMRQVLHYGSRNHWVATLQADLQDLGFPQVGPVDGIFGPKTEAGVKAFQAKQGFAVNGVTSPVVWQDMLAGFHLVPAPAGHSTPRLISPSKTNSTKAPAQNGIATTIGSPVSHVLPAQFPQGGTPTPEPSLSGTSAGIKGQFAPTVKTIDGRPVLKAYHMVATSYGPSLADNYPYGPTDAFGQPLQDGMVAVDPSVVPLHSVVYVTGYQDNYLPKGGFLGEAMDTGGAIKGDRVDIFINAPEQVINDFGVQQVTLYVLGN
ncbi:peptidoglycan-binding protein [Sulfobacillus sp. DSM 109850]|uniref:Peptidoglycan-binding protein n=2 Tax=Sulfobacillus harzensis TaxID=2729629 RepID=A0A7Y0L0H0_9FIRM|nr:3D domain-containing protein [Sulfobacillus harzensis]NMP21036.1 peptidoglycan-binding protein [Sulfobacillus harzensis]